MVESKLLIQAISFLLVHTMHGLNTEEVSTIVNHRMRSSPSLRELLQYDEDNQYDYQSPTQYDDIRMSTYGCDPDNQDCSQQDDASPSYADYEATQYDGQGDWSAVFVNLTPPSPTTIGEGSFCSNEQPPDATFSCIQYSSFGLCNDIAEQYCMEDCGRCIECVDQYVPGTGNCNSILANGQCESEGIKGVYCQQSCGYCPGSSGTPPTPPAPPTPTQPQDLEGTSDCLQPETKECDIDALLSFKNSLSSGQQLFASWQGDDPCKWRYIKCSQVDGVHDRVTVVELEFIESDDENQLVGQLVPQFSKLRYVTEFTFSGQEGISGSLPLEYSILDKLVLFGVWRTGVVGTYPAHFSAWTNLQEFVASYNQLTGTLPEDYSAWSKLEEFIVEDNENLIGTIPPHYSTWINMKDFHLSINHFSGTLPSEFSVWEQCCEDFYVLDNQFTGTIPSEYSTFKWIEGFAVNKNIMSGTLPATFSTWIKCCDFFYTSENKLSGTLPVQYSTMTSMDDFSVRSNFLEGTLPVQYSTMQFMEQFSAYKNAFTGTLPEQYSTMSRIQIFAVSDNLLSGTIPSSYSVWIRCCEYFYLYRNEISGTLPSQYSTMLQMENFQVTENQITGTLPQEYSTMNNLVTFLADDNSIVGQIPEEWSGLSTTADIRI
eukprot:TRINITY_DN36_c0_g1_i2.p1 TRINITY_DN36_c0_g1~~TRINITY_DN36_c0_g1_i2.p1  ORF type:complete len:657 (-),score=51.38 TRINITY_DN36_c0_g1_i2:349-2319(-)